MSYIHYIYTSILHTSYSEYLFSNESQNMRSCETPRDQMEAWKHLFCESAMKIELWSWKHFHHVHLHCDCRMIWWLNFLLASPAFAQTLQPTHRESLKQSNISKGDQNSVSNQAVLKRTWYGWAAILALHVFLEKGLPEIPNHPSHHPTIHF